MTARDRSILIVVLIVAAIAASWLLLIQPKRSQAAKLAAQITTEQSQLGAARTQVAEGESARSAYSHSYATLVRLGEAVPADDNVPSLIVQVQGAATASGVDFRSLTLNPGAVSSTPTTTATTPTTPTTTTSAAASQALAASLPPGASIGPAGFPVEPFTFTFQGSFFHLSDFFGRLQRFVTATNARVWVSGRLMTLNAISLGPGPNGFPQITASVSATTFIVPAAQGVTNGGTAAGPSSSQSVSTTPSTVAPAAVATPGR
jgi:hypothetical protein